jgi:phosphatidylglycerophosphate synthase
MAEAPSPPARPGIIQIYRRSLKPADLRFNNYACRPLAAVFVYLFYSTPITPNQVTFLSMLVALIGDLTLVGCPGRLGLGLAALLLYLSFVLDCADGQLARVKSMSSSVGSYLDFLMDEIKAVALIAAVASRLAIDGTAVPLSIDATPRLVWLVVGMLGVVIAASGCSLTTFMRRPEYFEAVTGKKPERVPGFTALRESPSDAPPAPAPSPLRRLIMLPIRIAEWLGKLTLHYPAWFYVPALLGHLEWFLIPYLAAHTLYLMRASLVVLVKLGR